MRTTRLLAPVLLAAGAALLAAPASGAAPSSPHPVTVTLSLHRTRAPAGNPIRGVVTITNTTEQTITVQTCALAGWLFVGLVGRHYTYSPIRPAIACRPTVRLRPGATRERVRVSTRYQACTMDARGVRPGLPRCLPGNATPPLPAGTYHTKIIVIGLPRRTRLPRPTTVRLSR